MLTRRVALPLAALTAFATLPVLASVAPAGASSAFVSPSPASRGDDNGDPDGPEAEGKEKVDPCPTKQWTIPLELKGLACLLLLPKPEPGDGGEGGAGGLGGLFG